MTTAIVAAIIGVLGVAIGSGGTYFVERFRRRGQMSDARRTAYANWFATEAMIQRRINTICTAPMLDHPDYLQGSAIELDALAGESRALLTALHQVVFLEKDKRIRTILLKLNDKLTKAVNILEQISLTYHASIRVKTSLRNAVDGLRKDRDISPGNRDLVSLVEEKLRRPEELHDATKFIRDSLRNDFDLMHQTAEQIREELAPILSK